MTTTAFLVTGMTCSHCVRAVDEEVRRLPEVRDVAITLVADGDSIVTVVSDAPLDVATVRAAVDEAGYTLVDASR